MELTIRRAVPADAGRIAELSGVLGYPVESELMAQRLERLTASPSDVVLVAALGARTLVGWLHGAAHELLETGAQCEIAGLVVDPEYRKLGAGRRL
ncbi:MAG TPA: GNAT family N-acetyltransferase, partial [Vicinamibacterales bacterium]|nr:GNAT family N-acetyltransferase [Vicinamibacterales bacterium]